jgi:hypothetical protein
VTGRGGGATFVGGTYAAAGGAGFGGGGGGVILKHIPAADGVLVLFLVDQVQANLRISGRRKSCDPRSLSC